MENLYIINIATVYHREARKRPMRLAARKRLARLFKYLRRAHPPSSPGWNGPKGKELVSADFGRTWHYMVIPTRQEGEWRGKFTQSTDLTDAPRHFSAETSI